MEKNILRHDYILIPIRLTSGKLEVFPLLGGKVQVLAMCDPGGSSGIANKSSTRDPTCEGYLRMLVHICRVFDRVAVKFLNSSYHNIGT